MSDENNGKIVWTDLTVPDAEVVRNFYCGVLGWKWTAHPMGDYDDYTLNLPDDGTTIAGVCYNRGSNANMPAQWLNYVQVASVGVCISKCHELGGKLIEGPRLMGKSVFAVIQDPSGAVMGIIGNE